MTWKIDSAHSEITFKVRHLMISNVSGSFTQFSGSIEFDEKNATQAHISAEIDPASINTREGNRDGHLKSPDFFDVASYPTITFNSTHIETTDAKHGKVTGDLTMHGVTKSVTLDVEFMGLGVNPMSRATSAAFTALTKINRKDWGLNWNVALEAGGWLVGDEITLNLEVELVQTPEQVTATA